MKPYLIAHDIGTSGDKATLYTSEGKLVDSVLIPYKTYYSNNTWAEQDPDDWWDAVCVGTRQLMDGRDGKKIAAIACTGTMMGCLCLDKDSRPLMKSIIWADSRSSAECVELIAKLGKSRINEIIGLPLSPNFAITKLMWLKKNRLEIYEKAAICVQSKDYISFRMTGRHVTDPTDADFYQCYDVRTGTWSDEIIDAAGIDRGLLPEIIDCSDIAGYLSPGAAKALGVTAGVPVIVGAGDGAASCIGSGAVRRGMAFLTMGSSSGFSVVSDRTQCDPTGRVPVSPHVIRGLYNIGGAMQAGGASLQWAQNSLYNGEPDLKKLDKIAESVPIGSNGIIFLPYLLGERAPIWNSQARGAFINLSNDNTKADMLRAVMEGVGLHLGLIHNIVKEYEEINTVIMNGGGAKSDFWSSMISDILGSKLTRYNVAAETTSFGAAMIAGVGIGIYKDFNIISDILNDYRETIPNMENHRFYSKLLEYFTRIYKSLEPIYNEMN